jgi:LPS export ABC transporter protein LptC|tara:strand:+ start:6062 stop:6598 length:537 start_codon:yes stop_codon:yes gene_type:complete
MRSIVFFIIILFNACKNDPLLVKELFSDLELPIELIEKSRLIHTENGIIQLEINANKIERFNKDNTSKLIFSEGFEVIFYDNDANYLSNLSAKDAVVDENNNIMEATNSVVLKNKNRMLETEYLIWDEAKDLVYTEQQVIITTEKEVIYAEGFSSDPDFKDYTLKKISGKMFVNTVLK